MTTPDPMAVRRGRRQFLLLAALFFVPLALAFWLYYGPGDWRPGETGTNMGDLVDPARPLPQVDLPIAGGSPFRGELLRGKWSLVYVGDASCDERCRKALHLTRQTRIALNKDADRVERVFLVYGNCCDNDYLENEQADLVVAIAGSPQAGKLLQSFPSYDDGPVENAGRIYVVDPLGNLVLSYSANAPDKALLTDLKKLLRLSHIG
jgi:cytochrome oxidase Cu insertion factor (SCO1/SenC/PrrC family)